MNKKGKQKIMLKNITPSSKIIGLLGMLVILYTNLSTHNFNILTLATLLGGLLGFASVILIVNRNWWAGITGLVSAILYIFVAIMGQNPSDAILNVFFIVSLDIPIILNKEWQTDTDPNSITMKQGLILLGVFLIMFVGMYYMESAILHTPRALWSPLASSLGITAAVSTGFMRVKQGFIIWSLQNILQVVLWSMTAQSGDAGWGMAVVYMFYTLNAGSSFFNGKWFK